MYAIISPGIRVMNLFTLAGRKILREPVLQKIDQVALSRFRAAAAYLPKPLRFKPFSRDAIGGSIVTFAVTVLGGAAINLRERRKKAQGGNP